MLLPYEYLLYRHNTTIMRIFAILMLLISFPFIIHAQSLPECDSVVIDCCFYDTFNPNTVDIEVSNYSSNIFSYPGFILFDENMDTVAKETVNYFGIGWDQIHSMTIVKPFDLPFEGKLELHTGFYSNYACTFPIIIPDTTLTLIETLKENELRIFPSPANNYITIEIENSESIDIISIMDINGRNVKELNTFITNTINISDLNKGIYTILIHDKNGKITRSKFIKM